MPNIPLTTLAVPLLQRNRISSRPRLPASLKPNPTLSLKHSMSAATLRVKDLLTPEELKDRQKVDELQGNLRAHAEHKRRVYDYDMSVKLKKQQEEGGELEINEEEQVDNDMAEKMLEILDVLDRMVAAFDKRLLQKHEKSTPTTAGAVFSRPLIVKRFPSRIQNNESKPEAGDAGQDKSCTGSTPTESGTDEPKSNASTPKPGYDENGIPLMFKLPAWKAMMGEYSPTIKPCPTKVLEPGSAVEDNVESATDPSINGAEDGPKSSPVEKAKPASSPKKQVKVNNSSSSKPSAAAAASASTSAEADPQYMFTREQLIEFACGPPEPPRYPRPDDLSPYYQPVTLHPSRLSDPVSLKMKAMADKIGMVLIDHNITREMERQEGIIRRDPAKELIQAHSRSGSVDSKQSRDYSSPFETKRSPSETQQSTSEAKESPSKTEQSPSKTEQSPSTTVQYSCKTEPSGASGTEQSAEPIKYSPIIRPPQSIFGTAEYHRMLMMGPHSKKNGRFNSTEMKEYIKLRTEQQVLLQQELKELARAKLGSVSDSEDTDSESRKVTKKKPKKTFHSGENLQKKSTPPKIMTTVTEVEETPSSDFSPDEYSKSSTTSETDGMSSNSNIENKPSENQVLPAYAQRSQLTVPGENFMTNMVTRRNNPFKTPLKKRSAETSGVEDDGSVYSCPSGWGSRQAKREEEESFVGLDSDSDEASEESPVPSTTSQPRRRPKEFQLLGFSMEDVFLDKDTGAFRHPDRTIGGVGNLCRKYGALAWEMYKNGELVHTPKAKVEPKSEEGSDNNKPSKKPFFGRNPTSLTSNIFSVSKKASSNAVEKSSRQRGSSVTILANDNQNEQENKNGLGAGMRRIFGSNFGARTSKDGLQTSESTEGLFSNRRTTNRMSEESYNTATGTDPSLKMNPSNEARNDEGNHRVLLNNTGPRPLPSLPALRQTTNLEKAQKASRIPAWPLRKLGSNIHSEPTEPVPPVVLAPPSRLPNKQNSRVPVPSTGISLKRPQSGAGSRPLSRTGGTRPLSRSGSRASNRAPSRATGRRGSGSNPRPCSRSSSIKRMGAVRNAPAQNSTTKAGGITRTKGVANLRMLDNRHQPQTRMSQDGNRSESRSGRCSTLEGSRIPTPQGRLRTSFGFMGRSKQSSNQQSAGPSTGGQANEHHNEWQVRDIPAGERVPAPHLMSSPGGRYPKPTSHPMNTNANTLAAPQPRGELIWPEPEPWQLHCQPYYNTNPNQ